MLSFKDYLKKNGHELPELYNDNEDDIEETELDEKVLPRKNPIKNEKLEELLIFENPTPDDISKLTCDNINFLGEIKTGKLFVCCDETLEKMYRYLVTTKSIAPTPNKIYSYDKLVHGVCKKNGTSLTYVDTPVLSSLFKSKEFKIQYLDDVPGDLVDKILYPNDIIDDIVQDPKKYMFRYTKIAEKYIRGIKDNHPIKTLLIKKINEYDDSNSVNDKSDKTNEDSLIKN